MTPTQLIKHFGGVMPASRSLGLNKQVVYRWVWDDRIPLLAQVRIERKTRKKLRADIEAYLFEKG